VTDPTNVYLAIRTVDSGAGDGRPVLPGGWTCVVLDPNYQDPAWEIRRPSSPDDPLVAMLAATDVLSAGDGLYLVAGDQAYLESLGALAMPARELWRLAKASAGTARTVARAWRWWRCDLTEEVESPFGGGPTTVPQTGVVRELVPFGVRMPSPATAFPWYFDDNGAIVAPGSATKAVSAITRPGFPWTVAGLGLNVIGEDEPDRG